ncbi:flagellar hook-associated protein FlgK [Heliobacterium chlorum]|uniref:Flagellar hook-associated protein 1 n=1 Tax=Heliobacterium chlorum TaxID=2698 RepID=A0ABR7T2N6_HELCL|nr:flagellar hook-associated protein FlgK [Heliobacterium chlorum]MBC9784467.1 flagellar hook-associated protein FlgK [Heliobacterium chlorum]
MLSSFFGLEIARRGLMSNKMGLDVTGHNIANANTEGYSRQTVVLGTTPSLFQPSLHRSNSAGQIGTGVNVDEIRRYRDSFLDMQYRNESRSLGYWNIQSDVLQKIQNLLGEQNDTGLSKVMDQFWESLEDLTAHPEQPAARGVVIQRGKAVAETFSYLSRQLRQLETDYNDKVKSTVDTINSYGKQIADLNKQILAIEVGTDKANDLRDKRDLLLDKLSSLIDITVSEDSRGMVNVGAGNGSLVTGVSSREIHYDNSIPDANGKRLYEVFWDTGTACVANSGELKGCLEARGAMVPKGETNVFGTQNFDWQANVDVPSRASVVDVTSDTIVGTYQFHINTAAAKSNATMAVFAAPAAGHSETYKITGLDGKTSSFQISSTETIDDAVKKFNALTSITGVEATKSGGAIQLTATKYGVYNFSVERFNDAATPASLELQNSTGGANVVITNPVTVNIGSGTTTVGVDKVDGTRVTLKNGLVVDVTGTNGTNVNVDITKREGIVPDMRRRLQKLALTFASQINQVHEQGVSLEDIQKNSGGILIPSKIKFFVDSVAYNNSSSYIDPTDLENLIINPVLDDSSKLAAGRPESSSITPYPTTTYEGDGRNALALSQLKYNDVDTFPQPCTLDDYYRNIIGDLGVNGQQATRMSENQTTLTETVKGQRDAITSVSLDEELTNMIRYQQAYNSAARMITAADEMLDTIISRMGVVGR